MASGGEQLLAISGTQWLAIISSLAGAIGACLAFLQIRASRQTVMHDLYFRMRERYIKSDVNDAFVRLFNFREAHGPDFAEIWYQRFTAKDPEAMQLNSDRRLLSSFFADVVRSYKMRALSFSLASTLVSASGTKVFLDACMPLNKRYYGADAGGDELKLLEKLYKKSQSLPLQ